MFTMLLLFIVFVSIVLRFLSDLLPPSNPEGDLPTDSSSSDIQIPSSHSISSINELPDAPEYSSSTPQKVPSSSSAPASIVEHHVFLSFRGEDTRRSFTDHLYYALRRKGINTFRDTEKLGRGKSIKPELSNAINNSQFAVIIFSPNYATSSWCLDELAEIAEKQDTPPREFGVFPVFYHVEASDVRHQKGKFGEAFCKHEKTLKNDMAKVNKWRNALKQVANLSGWDLKGRSEAEVSEDIATHIWNELNTNMSSADQDLIGMDDRIEKMMPYLDLGSEDIRIIGISGMGGIGKTTLAQEVFKKFRKQFHSSGFIAEVRDRCSKTGLVELQKELCGFLELDRQATIQNVGLGTDLLKERLRHKRVLIILDDVDNCKQIEALAAGKPAWLGRGSRVIITTRDTHTLTEFGVPEDHIYEVDKLTDKEGFQLLCRKAFTENHAPADEFIQLSNKLVKYAQGLPLALDVLGRYLCGRVIEEWSDALASLEENPDRTISKVLKLSYDGLSDENHKKMFLDIACFFRGASQNRVTKIFQGCGFYPFLGLSVLVQRSLIKIERERLWMHDLLQQVGWDIVHQENKRPGNRSRLWMNEKYSQEEENRSTWMDEDARQVITQNLGTDDVEGLYLSVPFKEEISLKDDPFLNMPNLRLLKIRNVDLLGARIDYLSNNLRLLEWHKCPLESLPSSYHPYKLVELKMPNSRIQKLWNDSVRMNMLIVMDLSFCKELIETPDFNNSPNLEELILEGCENMLIHAHTTVWELKKLKVANFKNCGSMEGLPSFINFPYLETLLLSGCSKLTEFPEIVGNMESLSRLHLDGTSIRELPETIERLSGLIWLDLSGCKNLVGLPSVFSRLTSLKFLKLMHCSCFEQLPEDIGSLENLEYLDACHTAIRKVPSSIVQLKKVRKLCFHGCRQGQGGLQLPRSFIGLISLENLYLSDCGLGEGDIPDDIGCLSSLKYLRLHENNFESIPESISQLPKLIELQLSKCTKLRALPKHLPQALHLDVWDCPMLENNRKGVTILASAQGVHFINMGNSDGGQFVPIPLAEEHVEGVFPTFIEEETLRHQGLQVRFRGTRIPDWCSHKRRGCSVALQLSDAEVNRMPMGIALFVVFEIIKNDNFDPNLEFQDSYCLFQSEEGPESCAKFESFNKFLPGHSYVLCFYRPREMFVRELKKASLIEGSVSTSRPDIEVKWCGMHLVVEHNAQEFAQKLSEVAHQEMDLEFGRHCVELMQIKENESSSSEVMTAPNESENVIWKDIDVPIKPGDDLPLLLSTLYEGSYGLEKEFNLTFPQSVIPWPLFFHHYVGNVALCPFPQSLVEDQRWIGLELYVVVSSRRRDDIDSILHVDLCSHEISTITTDVVISSTNSLESGDSGQLVVLHVPRMRFPAAGQWNECQGITALFRSTDPHIDVITCGCHLLYKQDLADWIPIENLLLNRSVVPAIEREKSVIDNCTTKQPQQDFTSILEKYRIYLQRHPGFSESETVIQHPKRCLLDNGDHLQECYAPKDSHPIGVGAHHLHVVVETQLYKSPPSKDWKMRLQFSLWYSKVATLSIKGQMISSLKLFDPSEINNSCFPRKELPGWFREQISARPITLNQPRNLYDDVNWRGLAICASFLVHEHPSAILDSLTKGTSVNLMCHFKLNNGEHCLNPAPVFTVKKEKFKWLHLRGFIWICYIPRFYLTELKVAHDMEVRIYNDCRGLMMKKWSLRPLFEQDVEGFKQSILECWSSFFDNLAPLHQFVEGNEDERPGHLDHRGETDQTLKPRGNLEDFNRDIMYNATVPQCTPIMEWFVNSSPEASMQIQLPPSSSSGGNWIGLSLFAKFSYHVNPATSPEEFNPEIADQLVCHLETEKASLDHLHQYRSTNEVYKPTGFVWLSYIPRQWFVDQLNERYFLEASFASESQGWFADMCGVRFVYENDEEEFKQLCNFMNSLLDNEKSERSEEHVAVEKGKQVLEYPKPEEESEQHNSVWLYSTMRNSDGQSYARDDSN